MARIFHSGFELNQIGANTAEGWGAMTGSAFSVQGTTKRSGSYAAKVLFSSSTGYTSAAITQMATGRTYYFTIHLYVGSNPSSATPICDFFRNSTPWPYGGVIKLNTNGSVGLWVGDAVSGLTQVASNSGVLSAGWHTIELSYVYSSGAVAARIDGGADFASGSTTTSIALNRIELGGGLDDGNVTSGEIYIDDVIVNDDQGATSENTYAGAQKVLWLPATSDNNRGNWLDGGGGTSNLFESLNNTPPTGNTTDANAKQIKNATSSGSVQNADFNAIDYSSAGIGAGDTIKTVQLIARCGNHASSLTIGGSILIVSNPAEASPDTFTNFGTSSAHGTEASANWVTRYGTIQYSPSVTLGTQAVIRITKTKLSSTNQCEVDALGLMVTYLASTGVSVGVDGSLAMDYVDPVAKEGLQATDFAVPACIDVQAAPSWQGSVGRDALTVGDFLAALLREASTAVDWQGVPLTVRDSLVSIDWLTAVLPREAGVAADWTSFMAMLGTPGLDWRMVFGTEAVLPAEILSGRGKDGVMNVELLAGIGREGRWPVDWQGIILTLRKAVMPVDWIVVPAREGSTAADWQVFIGLAGSGGIEWRVSPTKEARMPVDALVALAKEAAVQISVTCPSGVDAVAGISWQQIIERVGGLGVDYRIEVTKDGLLEIRWQGKIVILSIGKLKNVQMLASEIEGLSLETSRMAKVNVEVGTAHVADVDFIA